jgi:hypothetical protein
MNGSSQAATAYKTEIVRHIADLALAHKIGDDVEQA